MNRREERYSAYLGIMLGLVMLICNGCTTYEIIRNLDGTTSVFVKSWRSFEDVALEYNRDGEVVKFKFGAASVVSQTPIDAAIEGIKFGVEIASGRSVSDNTKE